MRTGLGLEGALYGVAASALVLCLALRAYATEPPPLQKASALRSVLWLGLALLVWTVTNSGQLHLVDDDYWLHAPLQGHMLRDEFPPRNPFFSALPLRGHYGRDLMIVATARALRWDLIRAQWVVTSVCQLLAFLTLTALFERFGKARAVAPLGILTLAVGINMGYMPGLLQFYKNNSAPVTLLLGTGLFLVLELLRSPRLGVAVLLGAVLGTLGFVYETHFGLLLLAAWSLGVLRWRWGSAPGASLAWLAGASVAGLISACLFGGAFTDLVWRRWEVSGTGYSAIHNQGQRAEMSFPKTPFFGLRLSRGDGGLVSTSFVHPPLVGLFRAFDHQGARFNDAYVPLWSWDVVRMHGLPLLLSPLTLWLLWRRRNEAGLLFWLFGAWAYLVPGAVDFGPIHEFEFFRWEFAAAFGLAAALGIALAEAVEGGGRNTRGLVAALILINSVPGVTALCATSNVAVRDGLVTTVLLRRGAVEWLQIHSGPLRIREADLQALGWLASQARPGQSVLVNFGEDDPWQILFESTLTNLTGLRTIGHDLPQARDFVGLPPFRMRPVFRDFLQQPSGPKLSRLPIDWIYLRLSPEEDEAVRDLVALPGVRLAHEVRTPSGKSVILRVERVGDVGLRAGALSTRQPGF